MHTLQTNVKYAQIKWIQVSIGVCINAVFIVDYVCSRMHHRMLGNKKFITFNILRYTDFNFFFFFQLHKFLRTQILCEFHQNKKSIAWIFGLRVLKKSNKIHLWNGQWLYFSLIYSDRFEFECISHRHTKFTLKLSWEWQKVDILFP